MNPPGMNPNNDDVAPSALSLQDLVGDATKGSPDVFVGHHMWHQKTSGADGRLAIVSPCRPRWTVA